MKPARWHRSASAHCINTSTLLRSWSREVVTVAIPSSRQLISLIPSKTCRILSFIFGSAPSASLMGSTELDDGFSPIALIVWYGASAGGGGGEGVAFERLACSWMSLFVDFFAGFMCVDTVRLHFTFPKWQASQTPDAERAYLMHGLLRRRQRVHGGIW